MTYLEIVKWREHQHYTNRNPPWVKLHTKLLENDEMRELTCTARLLSLLLLCVAAKRDNRIPESAPWLSVEVGLPPRAITKALDELLAVGYLKRTRSASSGASKNASADAMPRDREQNEIQMQKPSTNGHYEIPAFELAKLLKGLTDKDEDTQDVIEALCRKLKLQAGDLMYALECAQGPGVESPTRVAVATLKKRKEAA